MGDGENWWFEVQLVMEASAIDVDGNMGCLVVRWWYVAVNIYIYVYLNILIDYYHNLIANVVIQEATEQTDIRGNLL